MKEHEEKRLDLYLNKSDEDLMREVQHGEGEAMGMIFERYKTKIFNFCLSLLGNRADAEECTGDVFLAVVRSSASFDTSAVLSNWLYTIARNQCMTRFRRMKRGGAASWSSNSESGEDASGNIPDDADHPRDAATRKERIACVRHAITRLDYEQREAIVLRQYHGFRYDEISRILDCSTGKVKTLIFRAKEQLRKELKAFILEESL